MITRRAKGWQRILAYIKAVFLSLLFFFGGRTLRVKWLQNLLDATNDVADFLSKHPRIVAFAGFIVSLIGLSIGNEYLTGFGLGTSSTAFLFVYR